MLLVVTWGVAQINFGRWNIVVPMTIAVGKAALVILFFMQVRYRSRLNWVFVGAGFFWLTMMLGRTMSDYLTRAAADLW